MVTVSLHPQAHIVLKPPLQQQKKCDNCTETAIDGILTIQYDVERDSSAVELQVWRADWRKFLFQADQRFWS